VLACTFSITGFGDIRVANKHCFKSHPVGNLVHGEISFFYCFRKPT